MQTVRNDMSLGPIEPFNENKLKEALKHPDTHHVEVFETTEANIRARSSMLGVKKRFQKTGRNNDRKSS